MKGLLINRPFELIQDARYDRGSPFRLKYFLNVSWLLNQKSSEISSIFFLGDSCCVPRPWDFSSGTRSSFSFFLQEVSFWERS